jgi:RNA polymerase sigma factor (sigma-70 family)
VRDLSQETLAALSESIDRFDPKRGVRFSTWLLSIAKHVLGDELDRRGAQKRGGGGAERAPVRAVGLEEGWMVANDDPPPDAQYEMAVFRAKVEAAVRWVSKEAELTDFTIYRLRVLEGQAGKDVAAQLGTSEPTISRRVAKVRDMLRVRLAEVISRYSFTRDEEDEPGRNGLAPNPNKSGEDPQADAMFDAAIGEIWLRQADMRKGKAE